uniref:Uncharacterized protein n=1 Tax=Anabas testudineus TaxID=64144 RepID=A0A3Q1JD59_ANATE
LLDYSVQNFTLNLTSLHLERSGKVSGLEVEEFLLLYSYKQCFILVWSCFSYKCVIFLWGSFSCNVITI